MILGLNKYSQSTSCALVDGRGETLFALARERLTRKKYDGGDVAELVASCLEQTGVTLNDIELVVENCHLFRIDEFEPRLPFTVGQHYYPASYLHPLNLADASCPVRKIEIPHHLAHAYAALLAAPFEEALIIVMDGMGSLRVDTLAAPAERYRSERVLADDPAFEEWPAQPDPTRSWREAESAYLLKGKTLTRLCKRWTPLRSPSLLHNYGFENMESLGAIYSRISSHIFTDWNACGKVMGLAGHGAPDRDCPIMTGPLEKLKVNWPLLDTLIPAPAWDDAESAEQNRELAATVQENLEAVALDFVRRLREKTGARNLILTGGVALNSQMNARIAADAGFEQVFVPSAPGDDGVALGCAAFGLYAVQNVERTVRRTALTPFLGPSYTQANVEAGIAAVQERVDARQPDDLVGEAAGLIADGKVIGWFQGRSEYGPRALGNRSILAHPGLAHMPDHLNAKVKFRESFRPFAPTVLAEEARNFFAVNPQSPYMSFAVPVIEDARARIPAVTHVDHTARLQEITREANPLYYDLIARFRDLTGLPLVLNTSLNLAGEAIVETPDDALWSFLNSDMDALVIGPFILTKTPFPEESEWQTATLCAAPDLILEARCHVDGALDGAAAYLRGNAFDCTELGLLILEICSKPSSITDLLASPHTETTHDPQEVLDETKHLFTLGALELHRPTPTPSP